MSFRVILLENSSTLRYKLDNIIVTINGQETVIPLTDISTIVVDNCDTMISTRIMSEFAENNVNLIICNRKHEPIGTYLALNTHSRAAKIQMKQLDICDERKGRLWAQIIKHKLNNQLKVLTMNNASQYAVELLNAYIDEVQLWDSTNREGHGAKVYFNELFGQEFSRKNEEFIINSGLNYGYTIIRSYVARLCVGYGLNTMHGIFHKSEFNSFPLVDDLMEPFRPIVDQYVITHLSNTKTFTRDDRVGIINMLNHRIIYRNKKQYLCNAMEQYVVLFTKFCNNCKVESLIFPDVDLYLGDEL